MAFQNPDRVFSRRRDFSVFGGVCGARFVCVRELASSPRDAERWRDACVCFVSTTEYISVNCLLNAWQFYGSMDYVMTALCIICSAMKVYFQMLNTRIWKVLCRSDENLINHKRREGPFFHLDF